MVELKNSNNWHKRKDELNFIPLTEFKNSTKWKIYSTKIDMPALQNGSLDV